jgi:hypothetical protein
MIELIEKYELSPVCADGSVIDPSKYDIIDDGEAWGRHARRLKPEFMSDPMLPHKISYSGDMIWNDGWFRDKGLPCIIRRVNYATYAWEDTSELPYLELTYRRLHTVIRDGRVRVQSELVRIEKRKIS